MNGSAKFLTVVLVLAFVAFSVFAGTWTEVSVEEALQPYLDAVEELNAELGASMKVEDVDVTYEALVLSGKSVDQFKAELRGEYLQSLKSSDEGEKVWNEIRDQYYLVMKIYHGSNVEVDSTKRTIVESGSSYFPSADSNYQSVEDIRKATELVFTEECAETMFYAWALSADNPLFTEIEGRLYVLEADAPSGISPDESTISTIDSAVGRMTIAMELDADSMIKGQACFTLVFQKGMWLIDEISVLAY